MIKNIEIYSSYSIPAGRIVELWIQGGRFIVKWITSLVPETSHQYTMPLVNRFDYVNFIF